MSSIGKIQSKWDFYKIMMWVPITSSILENKLTQTAEPVTQ